MMQLDFDSVANRMRNRARSGLFRGDVSDAEQKYVRKCSTRLGTTTLTFTRDFGNVTFGWLTDPAHERCWHLSLACADLVERDAWLRAFFGKQVEHLWVQSPTTSLGQRREVEHWRVFCDDRWLLVGSTVHPDDLRAGGLHPVSERNLFTAKHAA